MLSKSSKYALKAIIYIAHRSQQRERAGLEEIIEHIGTPKQFTAKLLQQLSKAGVITSIKGPNGGFSMSEEDRINTNIRDIVTILDGSDLYERCGLGLDQCGCENPCPIHTMYLPIKTAITEMHTNYSIDYLAKTLDDIAVLK